MYEDTKSKISKLQRDLDSQGVLTSNKTPRYNLSPKDIIFKNDWDHDEFKDQETIMPIKPKSKKVSFSTKIFIFSILFFIITSGIFAYRFFVGSNTVSSNNIDIIVKAPVYVSGGESVVISIEVKNNNSVSLYDTNLEINFPSGIRDVSNTDIDLKRGEYRLGDISSGQLIKKDINVILLGVENEKKDFDINLDYHIEGSNSQFNKKKSTSIIIGLPPINIIVKAPKEVNTNQSINFDVEIISNSSLTMRNLLLRVDFPNGFSLVSSKPEASALNNVWLIGDLAPNGKRTISFSGILAGQEGEERGFNFVVGSQNNPDSLLVDVPLNSYFSSLMVHRPFVNADISLNGSNHSEIISTPGSMIKGVITWSNNLSYDVSDISIIVKLDSNLFNKESLIVSGGFYNSNENIIIFDKRTDPGLANLSSGEIGKGEFSFNLININTLSKLGLSNQEIKLDVSVNGRREDYISGSEVLLFSDSRLIKLTSDLNILSKSLYYTGPFKNTGPIPPKADIETTYTITWTATSPLNSFSNAQMKAVLPIYVKWLGIINPQNERLSYNENTNSVIWNIGNVEAGTGRFLPAREVSFQISFIPSLSQIGSSPVLVGEANLTAKDDFTLTNISNLIKAVSIDIFNDPYFNPDHNIVVK